MGRRAPVSIARAVIVKIVQNIDCVFLKNKLRETNIWFELLQICSRIWLRATVYSHFHESNPHSNARQVTHRAPNNIKSLYVKLHYIKNLIFSQNECYLVYLSMTNTARSQRARATSKNPELSTIWNTHEYNCVRYDNHSFHIKIKNHSISNIAKIRFAQTDYFFFICLYRSTYVKFARTFMT